MFCISVYLLFYSISYFFVESFTRLSLAKDYLSKLLKQLIKSDCFDFIWFYSSFLTKIYCYLTFK